MNLKLDFSSQIHPSLVESGQHAMNTYATAIVDTKGIHVISPFFKCRDYIQDTVFTHKTGVPFIEYGYDTAVNSWDGEHFVCRLGFADSKADGAFERCNALLESKGLPPLEATKLAGKVTPSQSYYLFKMPAFYNSTLFLTSVYSAAIRLLWWFKAGVLPKQRGNNEFYLTKLFDYKYKGKSLWEEVMLPAIKEAGEEDWEGVVLGFKNNPHQMPNSIHSGSGMAVFNTKCLLLTKSNASMKALTGSNDYVINHNFHDSFNKYFKQTGK